MQKTLFQHFLPWALAAACLGAMTDVAAAGSFTRGCVVRDMQILMLIEERESANAIAADQVRDSIFAMTKARIACYEGRVLDAFALYDSISQSISPSFVGQIIIGRGIALNQGPLLPAGRPEGRDKDW